MGRLTKQVLGRVSGKVGDVQFRQRNGKNYVAVNPESFIPGNDPASIERRNRFALTVKFSQAINSIAPLKEFWSNESPEGLSAYNYIIRKNYQNVVSGSLTSAANIVPSFGFGVRPTSVTISGTSVRADLDPVGTDNNIDTAIEKYFQLASVIYFSNPIEETTAPYYFLYLLSADQALDLVDPKSFVVSLTSELQQLTELYQNSFGYFSLLTLDTNYEVVRYSTTFTS